MADVLDYVVMRVDQEVSITNGHDIKLSLSDAIELADRLVSAATQDALILKPQKDALIEKLK